MQLQRWLASPYVLQFDETSLESTYESGFCVGGLKWSNIYEKTDEKKHIRKKSLNIGLNTDICAL